MSERSPRTDLGIPQPPRLLDLFCGAGGASEGYARAGFEVMGVDINPQPHYPFDFVRADAMELDIDWYSFDAIHASPPCQAFTAYQRTGVVGEYPDLIAETRDVLSRLDIPWVIENVEGAPLIDPVVLCGTMFDPPMEIQRHRLFETNWHLIPPTWPCRHKLNGRDRYPGGRSKSRTGSSRGLVRATVEIGSWDIPLPVQQKAMGIDWMTLEELSEAIPPVYTEHIGRQLRIQGTVPKTWKQAVHKMRMDESPEDFGHEDCPRCEAARVWGA